jgi:hypothetical protein
VKSQVRHRYSWLPENEREGLAVLKYANDKHWIPDALQDKLKPDALEDKVNQDKVKLKAPTPTMTMLQDKDYKVKSTAATGQIQSKDKSSKDKSMVMGPKLASTSSINLPRPRGTIHDHYHLPAKSTYELCKKIFFEKVIEESLFKRKIKQELINGFWRVREQEFVKRFWDGIGMSTVVF